MIIFLGDTVTDHSELAGEELNKELFQAVVTGITQTEDDHFEVTDAQGKKHTILRSLVCLHKRHRVVTNHVTDDKILGSHAIQAFH